jgi:hypothetical protein
LRGYSDGSPPVEVRTKAKRGKDGNVEPRNELEMGTEACRWKMILG